VSFLYSLFSWANVPFTVALGVTLVFALLQMTGVLGLIAGGDDHDADADHDADIDHDADVDHDAGIDHDGDVDHDVDADGHHDASHTSHGVGHQVLSDLGIGRVPFSIVWQTFAVAFALAGITANTIYLGRTGAMPASNLAWALPASLVVAYIVTRSLSRVLGRVIANPEQEATTRKALVGQSGVVISSKVDSEFGEVRLRDKTGHVVRIICRVKDGERNISEGSEVVIVDYDPATDRLFVAPLDEDDEPKLRIAGSQSGAQKEEEEEEPPESGERRRSQEMS
jgi:membrane protein implicated in regulation of membrane protease activity